MEILILLPHPRSRKEIVELKAFIGKARIEGVEFSKITDLQAEAGAMGNAVTDSITAIIHAAQKPLVELIKCLQKYVDLFRTEIHITTKNGDEIQIKVGRRMTAAEIQHIIESTQKSQ